MSGRERHYEEGVHDEIAGIAEPTDDSVTLSDFNNSGMTYSKSFERSRRSTRREEEDKVSSEKKCANLSSVLFKSSNPDFL